ncbi:hypothetical protein RHOSPDRAFT_34819 [Rhodotorula sp. JG-1b]|nr:hypothetical protein RHOSPDRAFT_34819 [Rhodotorula sp. JG-1b]
MKRFRVRQTPSPQRSPSPTLPLHLYTSLASSSAHHPLAAIQAREATLLDPREWDDDTLEPVTWTGWVSDDSQQQRREVITDRYDILHLVPSIPSLPPPAPTRDEGSSTLPKVGSGSGSGFGFEDLPSDHEELFFLNSSADRADLERRKKRRRLQDERDQRVRERLLQQQGDGHAGGGEAENHNDDDDDDEPPAEINQLMSRLHTTLSRSANPALLELRILANHGSDPRFASFLKREGRWYRWWVELREGKGKVAAGVAPKEEEEEEKPATATGGLGGLAAYGSDSDDVDVGASSNEGAEDGQDAQDRSSKAEAKDDAGPGASSSSTASVPESASTVPSTTTTTTITSTITSAPPPPPTDPSAARNGDSVERTTTVAQEVKAEEEEDREGGDSVAKRQEEEEKKEARATKAREWARKRREARLGLGPGLGGRDGDGVE